MKVLLVLSTHLRVTVATLPGPCEGKTLVTQNLLLKQQLLIP